MRPAATRFHDDDDVDDGRRKSAGTRGRQAAGAKSWSARDALRHAQVDGGDDGIVGGLGGYGRTGGVEDARDLSGKEVRVWERARRRREEEEEEAKGLAEGSLGGGGRLGGLFLVG